MASFEKPKSADGVPLDLLPVIRSSGVVNERQLAEIKTKVLQGDYPLDSAALAERLVRENILTSFQAKRLLSNKPQGLIVGRYIVLDRIGSGSMGRVYKAHHVMIKSRRPGEVGPVYGEMVEMGLLGVDAAAQTDKANRDGYAHRYKGLGG